MIIMLEGKKKNFVVIKSTVEVLSYDRYYTVLYNYVDFITRDPVAIPSFWNKILYNSSRSSQVGNQTAFDATLA